MEDLKIKEFVSPGYGYGSGSGDGDGSGFGSGTGFGFGNGFVYESYARYIKRIDGNRIYNIDGVPTILRRIRGNYAKGAIVNADLTTSHCFIAKQDGIFAHGETLSGAMCALRDKLFVDMPEDERIAAFRAEHEPLTMYPTMDFFDWHHKLTGSCEMGRRDFAQRHGIDLTGEMTVEEFIELTENDYGGEVIRKLKPLYGM